jgi:bloom syndrome protein
MSSYCLSTTDLTETTTASIEHRNLILLGCILLSRSLSALSIPFCLPLHHSSLLSSMHIKKEIILDKVMVQAENFDWQDEKLQAFKDTCDNDTNKVIEQIIRATMSGKDDYASMLADRDKDKCYVIPARLDFDANRGTTIVVSPFRALLKDRAASVEKRGVSTLYIDNDTDSISRSRIIQDITENINTPSIIYLSPDSLMHSEFVANILDLLYDTFSLKRIVLEEANHICQVAQESIPGQLDLKRLRLNYPKTPIMCIAESPSRRCREKVLNTLGLKLDGVKVFAAPLDFINLSYQVIENENKVEDMILRIKTEFWDQCGIVYCHTRVEAEVVAARLQENDIQADYYHAQRQDREQVQDEWLAGRLKVIVATIAFCTGNNKGDVRFVFHHSIPMSFDAYYRQVDKAGRDGQPASSVLYYSETDKMRARYLIQTGTLDPDEDAGYRDIQRDLPRSLANRPLPPEEVLPKSQKDHSIQFELNRFMQMVRYANEQVKCRRQMILNYFGQESFQKTCSQQCDNCIKVSCIDAEAVLDVDVTKYASHALKLIADSTTYDSRITKTEAIEALAGANNIALRRKGILQLKSYGTLNHKSMHTIEKILNALETRFIIGYFPVDKPVNGEYLHLRVIQYSHASAVHEGRLKIKLPAFQVSGRPFEDDFHDITEEDLAKVDAVMKWPGADAADQSSDTVSEQDSDEISEVDSLPVVAPIPGPSDLFKSKERKLPRQLPLEAYLEPHRYPAKRSSAPSPDPTSKRQKL